MKFTVENNARNFWTVLYPPLRPRLQCSSFYFFRAIYIPGLSSFGKILDDAIRNPVGREFLTNSWLFIAVHESWWWREGKREEGVRINSLFRSIAISICVIASSPVDGFSSTLLVPQYHAHFVVVGGTNITRKVHFVSYNPADSNHWNWKWKNEMLLVNCITIKWSKSCLSLKTCWSSLKLLFFFNIITGKLDDVITINWRLIENSWEFYDNAWFIEYERYKDFIVWNTSKME